MRILITGATGFVGARVVEALAQLPGTETIGLARHAPSGKGAAPGVRWLEADVLHEADMQAVLREVRPNILLHAAWYVEHGKFWTAPENEHWAQASLALAAHFFEAGGRRMVGLGTCAEYDPEAPGADLPWREDRTLGPSSPYGAAKAWLASRLFELAAGDARREVAWARLFHLFGPGEQPGRLVPSVLNALRAGEPARCGPGALVRDFASTWHVGRALAALARSHVSGAVNVASGMPVTIAALTGCLAALLGRQDLLRIGELPARLGEVPFMVANTGRLQREVGFREAVELEASLRQLVAAVA